MKSQKNTFFITNKTKGRLARLPFVKIKETVLGKKYLLSLVFTGNPLSQALNLQYRKKNKPANILSFPLEKYEGEIFINTVSARKESAAYNRSYKNHIGRLFIHGLFHLKGRAHSSTMEKEERKTRKQFSIK